MQTHLKHFLPLAYAEFWDRVSFYGLQSLVVIILTGSFHQHYPDAYDTYGAFSGLSFGFGVIGGIIADKLLGIGLSLLCGALLCSMIGNILLIHTTLSDFYLGMAFIVVGIGLLKPANVCALNQAFDKDGFQKAFTYFYLSANTGSIIGPLVYGFGIVHHYQSLGFICAGLGLSSVVITLILSRHLHQKIHTPKSLPGTCYALISTIAAIAAVDLIVSNIFKLQYLIAPAFILLAIYLIRIYRKVSTSEQAKLIALIIPACSSLILSTLLLQMFSSIVIWLKTNLPLSLAGWHIPPTWFGIVTSFFVLIAPACISFVWKHLEKRRAIRSNIKLVIGLITTALAFALLALSALLTTTALVIIMLLIAAFLLGLAEIIIIPVSMALTSENAPANTKQR